MALTLMGEWGATPGVGNAGALTVSGVLARASMHETILKRIKEGPMSLFQISAVVICWVVNMLDGFDVLAISFTAPDIARQWNLNPTTLGVVFSIGLVGMAVGAMFLAPFADIIGRRRMILLSLGIVSA